MSKKKPTKRGRKDKWTELDMDNKLDLISHWAMQGATEKSMQESLGVSHQTFADWKKLKPEFMDALRKGREVVDATVVNKLLKRAQGYDIIEEEVEELRDDLGTVINSKVKTKTRHIPSSDTALIFWLKNRMPEEWRDRIEQHNTGEVEFEVKLIDDSEEDDE